MRPIGIVLLIVGIILISWGVTASDSFSSDVSRLFTGSPTDKAMYLLIGGTVAVILGVVGLARGGSKPA